MGLLNNSKITECLAYASGTAVRSGATLDMLGYDGVLIIMKTATIAASAVGDLHAETSTDSGFSGGTDLIGTAIVTANDDDDQLFVLDIYKPLERYIRGVVTKDTSNAMAETVNYIQYNIRKGPVDNEVDDTITSEFHVSPARGTK